MKKNVKPFSIVITLLITAFFFVILFPGFKSQAGALGNTYLYLSRIRADLNGITTLTGTVSVTNGSTTVTGSGTLFNTELTSGDVIKIAGGFYTVSSITSDTSLTLSSEYLDSNDSGLTATTNKDVEMILAITPSQDFFEADNIKIEIQFPMADDEEWCRTAGTLDLTVAGVATAPPDITGHEITAALPGASMAATCTQGNGSSIVDTITISNVGDLVNTETYGVKLSNDTGILGTSATEDSRTITVQLSDDNNLDSKAFDVYLISTDIVTVTAKVEDAPTITCDIDPTSSNIGTLYPGGALVTVTTSNQLSTSSTNSGYYWAVYGKGDGTDAGLYNAAGAGYTLESADATIDLTGADTRGFGLTVTPPGSDPPTVATDFDDSTPGTFGGVKVGAAGAKLLMYKTTDTSPEHSVSINYGARADTSALSGTYTECGGYY